MTERTRTFPIYYSFQQLLVFAADGGDTELIVDISVPEDFLESVGAFCEIEGCYENDNDTYDCNSNNDNTNNDNNYNYNDHQHNINIFMNNHMYHILPKLSIAVL